jgi:DNA-directed RNA polymerase subunit M/transcription elongation factor TFIIS
MTTTVRQTAVALIKDKIEVSNFYAIDLEKGIYNWCIEYANSKGVIKNWDNPVFVNIYNDKFRSVVSNLDKTSYLGNDRLLDRLMAKEFLPHDIPFMKPENVFPEQWHDIMDIKLRRDELLGTETVASMSDQFRCARCHKRETSYYELQTRSADESMSLFIKCLNCNNSWKM